jgi:hypothetical protein
MSLETSEPATNALPVEKELRQYFAGRGLADAQIDEAIRQFSGRAIKRSLQVLKHAGALKALVQRFSQEELRTLAPDARANWLLMIRQHAQALQQESSVLRREVSPVFPSMNSDEGKQNLEVRSSEDLVKAVERLFGLCSENDRVIRSAFSLSPDSSRGSQVKSPQFWGSLQTAEVLAARISDFRF